MEHKDFKNILITTRLGYMDEWNCPSITEERNLFFINKIKNAYEWGNGVDRFDISLTDIEELQYSNAFNFPELFEKSILEADDFSDRRLKRGDFNKEFKFHETSKGEYFLYFTYKKDVFRLRGVAMMFEFDVLTYSFHHEDMELVSSVEFLSEEVKNYWDTVNPKIRKNKLMANM